ncbi:enoyl-CoA hydratase, partial [Clostridioides difficile]|nr:enoyl-CoA hydratase [Clostridioides difficile]
MSQDFLIDEPVEGVKRITLNRPEAMNAFTFAMYQAFIDLLTAIKFDPKVRV